MNEAEHRDQERREERDDLLLPQEHKGYGDDEGEREEILEREAEPEGDET
jgi:hypothetical protein